MDVQSKGVEMSRKEIRWMVAGVIFAGFSGGLFSGLFFSAGPVWAQKKSAQQSNFVKAEAFELVDQWGVTRAKLMMGSEDEPMLVVYDKNHKATAAYGLNGDGPIQNLLGEFFKR